MMLCPASGSPSRPEPTRHLAQRGSRRRSRAPRHAEHPRPLRPAEQRLLTPPSRITRRLRPHPAGLAPLRPEQGIEEQTRGDRHALLLEQGPDPPLHVPQRVVIPQMVYVRTIFTVKLGRKGFYYSA